MHHFDLGREHLWTSKFKILTFKCEGEHMFAFIIGICVYIQISLQLVWRSFFCMCDWSFKYTASNQLLCSMTSARSKQKHTSTHELHYSCWTFFELFYREMCLKMERACFPSDVLRSSIGSMAHSGTAMANPWGSGVKCRLCTVTQLFGRSNSRVMSSPWWTADLQNGQRLKRISGRKHAWFL